MIGWLCGRVLHYQDDGALVLDVAGVGYEVHVATSDRFTIDEPLELFVYTSVRADAIVLYGFKSYGDREFFELLLATPGVGPSTALAALRTMPTNELSAAIESGDVKRVGQIPGIGPKTASRIVLELKGKVVLDEGFTASTKPLRSGAIEDALRALGYSVPEIRQALADVTLPEDESDALRESLQLLRRQ
ncbi:MAG: Holliday junction branch migration protein RuvA [Acidimicrobiales bacterium]